jgi:hypothetical protein
LRTTRPPAATPPSEFEALDTRLSRYDLYVYSPGDWVWNLVGSYTEWPNAATAKDEWVRYVEQGGTYQLWLDSQRSTS